MKNIYIIQKIKIIFVSKNKKLFLENKLKIFIIE